MMLTHCGNNVRNRYSGCVFSVKDIVPVPLKTSRNHLFHCICLARLEITELDSWRRFRSETPTFLRTRLHIWNTFSAA